MFRHYLIAALRNMAANRLLSAISILSLIIGFTAAILSSLVLRNELTYEHFLPGHERTYILLSVSTFPGEVYNMESDSRMAELLRLNVPEIAAVTRLEGGTLPLKHGEVTARETIQWGDPSLFAVLPFPALYGDPATALSHPDGVVLTRRAAEKYFGRDDAVGQAIAVDGHPMLVRAVIKDMPPHATSFQPSEDIAMAGFVSTLAAFAPKPSVPPGVSFNGNIYVRLKPAASVISVNKQASRLWGGLVQSSIASGFLARSVAEAFILPIDQIHASDDLNPGIATTLTVSAASGLLILFIAVANFINLTLARAVRRQREVATRKTCGASRGDLVRQFLGEALVCVAIAACVAVAIVEWLLPTVNAFLHTGAAFDYWRDPLLAMGLLLGVLTTGAIAGAYPAFILSGFSPARVLKGWHAGTGIGASIRNILVAAQFAILVLVAIAAAVIYQQKNFAARDATRANIDQMLIVKGGCKPAFVEGVQGLAGVKGAACSNDMLLDSEVAYAAPYKGKPFLVFGAHVDPLVFSLYGITPIAGSLPAGGTGHTQKAAPGLVITQSVVPQLGFASPNAALGQIIWRDGSLKDRRIVAVVRDFSFHSVEGPPKPMLFAGFDGQNPQEQSSGILHIRLSGRQIPETLDGIDHLWTRTGGAGAINRFFLDVHLQERYIGLLHRAELFTLFAGIAIFLACLGLVGIAVSTAERRTKEIGIRKATGAANRDIVMMLLWQFAQPVLWANVLAWPAAWWIMNRWLAGFSAHVDLHLWLFLTVSVTTLAFALATVAGQAFLVARQKPVLALRYE